MVPDPEAVAAVAADLRPVAVAAAAINLVENNFNFDLHQQPQACPTKNDKERMRVSIITHCESAHSSALLRHCISFAI